MTRRRPLTRLTMLLAGLMLVIAGVPVFAMPIPVGAIMIAAGVVLLMRASPRLRLLRRRFRRRFPGVFARLSRWWTRTRGRAGI